MGISQVRFCAVACASVSIIAARVTHAGQRSPSPPLSAGFGSSASMSISSGATASSAAPVDVPIATAPTGADTASDADAAGSTRWYARRGLVELGGFANFSGANNFTSIQVSPTAGFFLFDGIELTAIVGVNYVHQKLDAGLPSERSDHKMIFRLLAEPSYHLPLTRTVWGFLGVGIGVASLSPGAGITRTGFDIAPRAGANFLVGGSGIVTPAAFVDYTTNESTETGSGNMLGVKTTYGLEAGYTVTW